jgi:hypothetical protein
MNALERLSGSYESQVLAARRELKIAEGKLRDYQARLGRTFIHDGYLTALSGLRDQLKAALSEGRSESGTAPPSAEIAERIQALRGGHTIEPAPERAGKRREAAETPVTSRIRERVGSLRPDPEPETDHPLTVGVSPHPELTTTRFTFVKLVLSDFSLPIIPRIEVARRQVAKLTARRPVARSLKLGQQLDLF